MGSKRAFRSLKIVFGPPIYASHPKSLCQLCRHRVYVSANPACLAFPEGIPDEIYSGEKDHVKAIEGDNDIQFEPCDHLWHSHAGMLAAKLPDVFEDWLERRFEMLEIPESNRETIREDVVDSFD